MAGVNKIIILGNLGRDPEVTYTQAGTAVCKITVATSESWNDKQTGEKKEKTEWHRITLFGKQAETVGQYMKKGSQIFIEGKLQTSTYEKNGETRYSTDIIASSFQFVGNKSDNAGQQQGQQGQGFQQNGGFQQPQQNQGVQQQQGGFQQNQGFQNQGNQGYSTPPEDD